MNMEKEINLIILIVKKIDCNKLENNNINNNKAIKEKDNKINNTTK